MNFKKTTAILMAGAITLMSNINILPQTMLNTASITANAVEIVKSGKCGENVTWTLDSNNTLTISGEGKMDDSIFYNDEGIITHPWGYLSEHYNLVVEEGITHIANYAFIFDKISFISPLPETLTSIGESAFAWVNGFDSFLITENISNIGKSAFEGCGISYISVDSNNESFSSENGILFNKDKTSILCFPMKNNIKDYTIPSTVTTIEERSFFCCENLSTLTIPESVKHIKDAGIAFNANLYKIDVDKNNTEYLSENAILFNKAKTMLITYPAQLIAKEYRIPDNVTTISSAAFSVSAYLSTIHIPNSVADIKKSAFELSDSISSLTLPDSLTKIDDYLFSSCTNLSLMELSDNITEIGMGAFRFCSNLTSIVIPENVKTVGNLAFYDCDKLESITFENPECNIYDSEDTIDNGATIYGYENSTAQKYAEKYDRNFVIIDEKPVTTTPVVTTTTIPTTTTTTITTTSTTSTIKTTTTAGSTTQPITTTVTTTPTQTPQISIGDIDSNKSINANDASMILAEYAIISTSGKPKFTAKQMKAADVNSDGEVNAIDASLVLAYYAHISTGGTGSLADFIASK